MGTVFLSEDPKLRRMVALKVLRRSTSDTTTDARRDAYLYDEARYIASLEHAHIITLFSTDEINGWRYLEMQLLQGQALDERVAQGPLDLTSATTYVLQTARAFQFAHSRRPAIIHRDIKPSKLFLTEEGLIKVLDFGIARALKEKASAAGLEGCAGTPHLISPESSCGEFLSEIIIEAPIEEGLALLGHPDFDVRAAVIGGLMERPDRSSVLAQLVQIRDDEMGDWHRGSLDRAIWALEARAQVDGLEEHLDGLLQRGATGRAEAHLNRVLPAGDLRTNLSDSLNAGAGRRPPLQFPFPRWLKMKNLELMVATGYLHWTRAFFRGVILDIAPPQRRSALEASRASQLLDIYAYRVWAGLEPPREVTSADLERP